jgi:uncharacterized protein (TIRG00374 family)
LGLAVRQGSSRVRRLFLRLFLVTLLGVLVYASFVLWAGFRSLADRVAEFRWLELGIALCLVSGNYVLRFFKWQYYLARVGVQGVRPLDSFLIFLSGFVLTITPGKIGEVFKSAVLAETHAVPAERTAPIVFAERLTDVIGVVVLVLCGSLAFSGGLVWALLGALLVVACLVLALWQRPLDALLDWSARTSRRGSRLLPRLREALVSLRRVAHPSTLLLPTLLSIAGWALEGVALFRLLSGFGATTSLSHSIFFHATSTLAGAVVPVPGGLGVTEALLKEQMVRLGQVDEAAATLAMMLIRFATLWWAVLVGFIALGLLKLRFPNLFRERLPEPETLSLPEER